MRNYHTRVLVLNYSDEDLPQFETQEEIDAWYQAVGRMVLYGMRKDAAEDTIQLVTAGLSKSPTELCAAYHPTLPARAEKYEDGFGRYIGSTSEVVDNFTEQLHERSQEQGRAFVMAAVLHSDGTWGFHS
jgi:hypothetical protein